MKYPVEGKEARNGGNVDTGVDYSENSSLPTWAECRQLDNRYVHINAIFILFVVKFFQPYLLHNIEGTNNK